jgi:hypothetical protein
MLRAAQPHVRMFGSDVCLVEADKRRKNKQMLSLLKNKARVYEMSEANINYTLSVQSSGHTVGRVYLLHLQSCFLRD